MLSLASEADLNAVHEAIATDMKYMNSFANFGAGPFNAHSSTIAAFIAQARQDPTMCQALFRKGTRRVYTDWLEARKE